MHIVIITVVLDFSALVLAEAVLSYVNIGVDPTTYSWGNMINAARLEMSREPIVWWSLFSAFLFMFVLVLFANLFSDAENFGLETPPGFDIDTAQEQNSKQTSNQSDAGADPVTVDGQEAEKREVEGIVDKIGKSVETTGDDSVSLGDADNIEGVETDTGGVEPQRGGGTSAPATASSSIEDPREVLKKKQRESIERNQKIKNRTDRRRSSFLGTPSSVENINKSVTPNNLDTGSNRGELVASVEITDEMKAQVLSPIKKDVDVKTERKSNRTVMIMEKPINMSSPTIAGASSGSGVKLTSSAVEDEKTLMKLQSSSTLKYT